MLRLRALQHKLCVVVKCGPAVLTPYVGGDPADDEYPDKPLRMRWATYHRLMDKLVAADAVADERLILLAARLLER